MTNRHGSERLRTALFIGCLIAGFAILSAGALALWVLLIRWIN